MISVKSKKEIELMETAGRITGEVLNLLEEYIKPGVTTLELDRVAENFIRKNGATPTFNHQVIHGIPSNKVVLKEGDIISIDVGACFKGYNGDAARTFAVGNISSEAKRLIDITKQSFFEGVKFCHEGARVSDISHAVQLCAENAGYGVVRDYVGHGVGAELHESPEIPNFGNPGRGARLISGMTLAIEPMINMGDYRVKVLPDGWTVETLDGCLSAHYENTVLITKGEPKLLTLI